MQLKEIMNLDVKTVTEDLPADQAWHRMNMESIHHFVVVRGNTVTGILSERDLGGPHGHQVSDGRIVAELMTPDVVTATPETTIQEAAELLRGNAIGCLPVMEGDRLAGIITLSDMLDLIGRGAYPAKTCATSGTACH